MHKFLLFICVVFSCLQSWSQESCLELLNSDALTGEMSPNSTRERPNWFGDIRAGRRAVNSRDSLTQKIQIRNVFGDFEINIIDSGNLYFVINPRSNESVSGIRYILHSVLSFYFGQNNVFDTESYRNIRVQGARLGLGDEELSEKIQMVIDKLGEIPSKKFITRDIIVAEHPFGQGLLDVRKDFFSSIPAGKFMQTLRQFIPFFVNTLPPHQNFILEEAIFSTADLTDNPEFAMQVSALFGRNINVLQERNRIRAAFLNGLRSEFAAYLVFKKALAKWKRLIKDPHYVSKDKQTIYLRIPERDYTQPEGSGLSHTGRNLYKALKGLRYFTNTTKNVYEVPRPLESSSTVNEEALRLLEEEERQTTGVGRDFFPSPRVDNHDTYFSDYNGNRDDPSLEDYAVPQDVEVGLSANMMAVFEDLAPENESSIFRTPLDALDVSERLLNRIYSLPDIETLEDLTRYPANELQTRFGFDREDFVELLPALTQLGLDMLVPYRWDRANYQLRALFPEYRRYRHTPRGVRWYMTVPSDNSGQGNDH